jgi:hypothetical protein
VSTYTPIASQTLSSAAASVTFSGIPQTYTDLVLVVAGTNASGLSGNGIRFNSDTSSNYSSTNLDGNGSSASSARHTNQTYIRAGISFTSQSISIINIQNYANTTTNKTVLARGGAAESYVRADVGLWRSTSAINSIFYFVDSGANFGAGTTFNLYGIATSDIVAPKATGGNVVISDGTYWYHAFTTSGSFTPNQAITADCLVIAGGGGAGDGQSGGGGAGGLLAHTSQSLTAQSYTVTVGAGGSGGTSSKGVQGSNSQFGSLTASVGGGFGGRHPDSAGGSGGSGGGSQGAFGTVAGGSPTSGQGNAGGSGSSDETSYRSTGGGGGAGAAGTNGGGTQVGGAGGIGSSSYSSWGSATSTGQLVSGTYYYAGGGGAGQAGGTPGAAGSGGGGAGRDATTGLGNSGTSNTGGGGGGGGATGGRGGSGIVIIRYAV